MSIQPVLYQSVKFPAERALKAALNALYIYV